MTISLEWGPAAHNHPGMGSRVDAPAEDLERPSWEQLYTRHFAHVWRVVKSLGARRKEDQEELVQEVFIAARAALPRYDPTRPAEAWLAGIARGVMSNWRARARPRHEVAIPAEELEQMQGHEPPAQEKLIEARDDQALLYRLLDEVDFEPRVVVVMHDLTGSEMTDIARELDVPTTTGFWRLKEGRRQLKAAAERARARDPHVRGVLPVPFDAVRFLNSHREAPEPPASARTRIFEALQRTPAKSEPSPPPGAAVAYALAGQTPGFLSGAVVVWALLHGTPPRADLAPPVPPMAAITQPVCPVAVARATPSADVVPAPRTPPAVSTLRPAPASSSADHETWLIGAALADLDEGHPRAALARLEEHARRFPNGSMKPERERLLARARAAASAP